MHKIYWHVHHSEFILEASTNIQERIDFISWHKPKHEHDTRLRLLKEVQGELPAEVIEAAVDYEIKTRLYLEHLKSHNVLGLVNSDYSYHRSREQKALYRLGFVLYSYTEEIEDIHERECADCPWDGYTIFGVIPPAKGA